MNKSERKVPEKVEDARELDENVGRDAGEDET